jgi:hypothetical protein
VFNAPLGQLNRIWTSFHTEHVWFFGWNGVRGRKRICYCSAVSLYYPWHCGKCFTAHAWHWKQVVKNTTLPTPSCNSVSSSLTLKSHPYPWDYILSQTWSSVALLCKCIQDCDMCVTFLEFVLRPCQTSKCMGGEGRSYKLMCGIVSASNTCSWAGW